MLGCNGHVPSGIIIRQWMWPRGRSAAELAASCKEEKYASIGSD